MPRTPFLLLGVARALLAAAFVIDGTLRHRLGRRTIAPGGFLHLGDQLTNALGAYMLALAVVTGAMLWWRS